MTKKYILAIDQGTTSTRSVVFNKAGEIIGLNQIEHKQIYPKPGWVEHDPIEIRDNTFATIKNVLSKNKINTADIASIGITNQRETTIIWNPKTGKPYHNALVWQDTRTSDICKKLAIKGNKDCFRTKTGLPLATYFSGPKIKWLLDNIKGLKEKAKNGEAIFGNIDTWIIWWLTGGPKKGTHVTDVTNASRTMLMNLKTLQWDDEMLKVMSIPKIILPQIRASSEIYGYTEESSVFKSKIPVAGDLGDQQAALFGQTCFEVGEAKSTYGTGCFLLMNTGEKIVNSKYGLLTTVGYKIGKEKAIYALEGSIAIAGSLVQWLRDNLELIQSSTDIEKLAKTVPDNGGIYFVPAFSGLFAPHWDTSARGLIIGLTHFVKKPHVARAVLESTCYQAKEIFDAMHKDSGIKIKDLKVDGGMTINELLMQFQADLLDVLVIRPKVKETTVLGAAYAAGLAVGFWKNKKELTLNWKKEKDWKPKLKPDKRKILYNGWLKAVKRTHGWMD